ncbi:MAG: hypothetical protein LM571_06710 [Desulfurococcaceae archaeon]|jgi:hypothetical protein|nr:hypothetical protein [Desulfurococcaceae archaeon]
MCEKATVVIRDKVAIVSTERGSKAIVPIDQICKALERLRLCVNDPRVKC